ncbi:MULTISPECIES: helix-turn-helix domain-containing protein [Halorussus]|uniref:helix-turn-helix domain-containing protein n=1 Tax=Halorussus TaxID=1070314 RepID=UPI000E210A56|nr:MULTISPECIES: helix-turn-helix domain-containing protein [Halorussus]NHN57888.1 bacterio-opsin activator [Halorussus sp. JP-T4]
MTLIADFYLETPVLRDALDAVPAMDVSVEQQTLREAKPFALSFWASGEDFAAFEAALADDRTVDDASVLTEVGDKRLYQVELTDEGDELMTYHAWADLGGVFISSERAGEGWRVRIRFPDRESLREYVDFCERRDLTFDLRSLYAADDPDVDPMGLTERQCEALRTATEMGYYDVPRRVELEDIAEVLGVSRQAVSERLRRATRALVRATIERDGEGDGEDEGGADAERGE